ncbi:MAG: 2,3-bisphosphoglycerate-independent phosphoglycerate mutase [Bacteroidota bacterium]
MKKVALIILDGWGLAPDSNANAVSRAETPFVDQLMATCPHSTLVTSGEAVGLPDGQMGNSEVGHLNIGAGRVVYQDFALINKAIREKTIEKVKALNDAMDYALKNNKALHLLGLVSDGGVHSHINHLKYLCTMAAERGLKNVFIHAFTDGRDADPKGGMNYLHDLEIHLQQTTGKIATVTGRYYAMDRDKRWERIKLAYDALVNSKGIKVEDWRNAVEESYFNDVTDEFIKPIVITGSNGMPLAAIKEEDAVICFNFRTDRLRELTVALTQKDFPEYDMHTRKLFYVTMTRYDETFVDVHPAYEKQNLNNTLGEVLAANGIKQIRIAETEKYPHVTFFFSGGREIPFDGETRIMIPSPKVATYDLKPEMSAREVTAAILPEIKKQEAGFICLNFANADMVAHSGVISAAIKAVETVDSCLKEIVETGKLNGYSFIIIADHGNADMMLNADGTPNTAHTTNPVPCILVDDNKYTLNNGKLADIAPTILELLHINAPVEMDGKSLLIK